MAPCSCSCSLWLDPCTSACRGLAGHKWPRRGQPRCWGDPAQAAAVGARLLPVQRLRDSAAILILQGGDVLLVSSKIHRDGTNLLCKSRENVILQEGRWGGGIYLVPSVSQAPYRQHFILF